MVLCVCKCMLWFSRSSPIKSVWWFGLFSALCVVVWSLISSVFGRLLVVFSLSFVFSVTGRLVRRLQFAMRKSALVKKNANCVVWDSSCVSPYVAFHVWPLVLGAHLYSFSWRFSRCGESDFLSPSEKKVCRPMVSPAFRQLCPFNHVWIGNAFLFSPMRSRNMSHVSGDRVLNRGLVRFIVCISVIPISQSNLD